MSPKEQVSQDLYRRTEELRALIEHHNYLYHVLGQPQKHLIVSNNTF